MISPRCERLSITFFTPFPPGRWSQVYSLPTAAVPRVVIFVFLIPTLFPSPIVLCSGGFAHRIRRFWASWCAAWSKRVLVFSAVSGKDGLAAFLSKEKGSNPFYQVRRLLFMSVYVIFVVSFFRCLFLWFKTHAAPCRMARAVLLCCTAEPKLTHDNEM